MFTHLKGIGLCHTKSHAPGRGAFLSALAVLLTFLPVIVGAAPPFPAIDKTAADSGSNAAIVCHAGLCGGVARAVIVYDGDLIVAGDFSRADNIPVNGIARWDGAAWHPLGTGTDGNIQALAVYNGRLIAGGLFHSAGGVVVNSIAAWDGASWSPLGSGIDSGNIMSLCVHGGQLIAAGWIQSAGSHPANNIIAWDGSGWSALGNRPSSYIWEVTSYYGELVAAGFFYNPNGRQVARWTGSDWVSLGPTIFDGSIRALIPYGGQLLAAGEFNLGGSSLAAWDGTIWSRLGTGPDDAIRDLILYNGELIAVGDFRSAGGQPAMHVARWDGVSWNAVGQGLGCCVMAACEYNGQLATCGSFIIGEDPVIFGAAAWDGIAWRGLSANPKSPFRVEIARDTWRQFGVPVDVPVTKSDGSENMYGFDFLLTYDAALLRFTGITPGVLFDSSGLYQWEYIDNRADSSNPHKSLIRVTAKAEINNGSHHPLETSVPDDTILFTLNFMSAPASPNSFEETPLRFYWMDCGDNTITLAPSDDTLALSDSVMEWSVDHYANIANPAALFQTELGAPDQCLSSIPSRIATRFANYYDGQVTLVTPHPIDNRGDINVNGIANEIADWVLFYNYFFQGVSVFRYPEASIAASDVNADGVTLRLEDLIFLQRVICGDTIPMPLRIAPHQALDSVIITQDLATKTVRADYPDTLAALYMFFRGRITPTFLLDSTRLTCWSVYDGEFTRLMIGPMLCDNRLNRGFTAGPLFTYTGNGLLIEKEDNRYPYAGIYDYPQAADFDNTLFRHNPIRIIGRDGRTAVSPSPVSAALARISNAEKITIYLGDFTGHTAGEIDPSSLRINDSLPAMATVLIGSYPGFSGEVLEISVSARSFIRSLDSLMTPGVRVYAVSGSFTGGATFTALDTVAIISDSAVILVPSGWPTIQAAVDVAQDGDMVQVDAGTYTGDGNRDIDFVGKKITLLSMYGAETTIIDCQGNAQEMHRFINFHGNEDSTTVIDGFTIRGGYAAWGGGLNIMPPAAPTIRRCVFIGNTAADAGGGAIGMSMTAPVISFCRFESNSAVGPYGRGGAIQGQHAMPIIENCEFVGNSAPNGTGGGIDLTNKISPTSPLPRLANCAFRGNSAQAGGGLSCSSSDPVLTNCVFDIDTTREGGGAVWGYDASPSLSYCLLSHNVGGAEGGGLWLSGGAAALSNCTIVSNQADAGTGVFATFHSAPRLDKCIIAYNSDGGPVVIDGTSSITFTCTDIAVNYDLDWTGPFENQRWINGNLSIDPLFCFPAGDDFRLNGISSCLPRNNSCHAQVGAYGWGCGNVCGDVNGDSTGNIGDAIFLINYIFKHGPAPQNMITADLNEDGQVDTGDAVAIVNYIFRGQPILNCMIDK